MAARNLHAAREAIAAVVADLAAEPRVPLRQVIARIRLRGVSARPFNDAEMRELLELVLANGSLPYGPTGEAALAYLVAERTGRDPVSAAINELGRHGANDDWSRHALVAWLDEMAARACAQAIALQRFADAKFCRKGEAPE